MFSLLSDENLNESNFDDFELTSKSEAPNTDASFVEEVTDNASFMDEEDDEDEFSVAAHASKSAIQTTTTKDGCSYVCVQPPNVPGHETQGNPKFAWCIKHGDRYPSATAFHEFVNTKYSKERNFMVRKTSSNRKAPKEIPDGCHPPDGIYAQMVVCTLAGAPARKKEGIAEEKRRDRKSLKCGCGWGVRGKWDWKSKEYVIQVEPEKNLLHTNGCNPTPAQKLISITKRTKGKIQRIPLDVLEDIKVMFEEAQPISYIRARIRNRIPLHIRTDARWFMNLRVRLEREKLAEKQPNSDSHADASNDVVPSLQTDAAIIPTVMRSIIGPILRLQGLPILNILSKLQQDVPGFMYEYVVDKQNQLAGWCYMTPRQRASLEDNGHVVFIDTNAKGTNKYGMPFFAPAVMNQDNKHDVVLYGCCMTSSGEAIRWILKCMCKMVPAFPGMNSTIFSDDGCPESAVAEHLPGSTHLLCAWHIIDVDLYNCGCDLKYVPHICMVHKINPLSSSVTYQSVCSGPSVLPFCDLHAGIRE